MVDTTAPLDGNNQTTKHNTQTHFRAFFSTNTINHTTTCATYFKLNKTIIINEMANSLAPVCFKVQYFDCRRIQ
jgi:hypothetical protein